MQPVSITPSSVHAEDYAEIVSRTATMRNLIAAGARIAELGYSDTDDLDATLRQAEDALYSVRDTTQQRDFQSFRDIFDRYLQEQQSYMYDFLTGTSAPVMSGFTDLDEVLGGFQRSDLVILAARPSVGKSTLGLNMAMANAKAGHTDQVSESIYQTKIDRVLVLSHVWNQRVQLPRQGGLDNQSKVTLLQRYCDFTVD